MTYPKGKRKGWEVLGEGEARVAKEMRWTGCLVAAVGGKQACWARKAITEVTWPRLDSVLPQPSFKDLRKKELLLLELSLLFCKMGTHVKRLLYEGPMRMNVTLSQRWF